MNCLDIYFQVSFPSKWFVANQTSEWFAIFMNCFDMPFQVDFITKRLGANQTSEWSRIFMNCLDMCQQTWLPCKGLMANDTLNIFCFLCHSSMCVFDYRSLRFANFCWNLCTWTLEKLDSLLLSTDRRSNASICSWNKLSSSF